MWPTRRALSGVGDVLLAGDLLAGGHVPQPELDLQPAAVAATRPVTRPWTPWRATSRNSARRRIRLLREARVIEGGEIARAAQVVGHDPGDEAAEARVAAEIRDGDRASAGSCRRRCAAAAAPGPVPAREGRQQDEKTATTRAAIGRREAPGGGDVQHDGRIRVTTRRGRRVTAGTKAGKPQVAVNSNSALMAFQSL